MSNSEYRIDALKKTIELYRKRVEQLSKQNTLLSNHLAGMCCQADEDTPSEYRTDHFRSTMDDAYEYLEEIGYFKKEKIA
jgi:hypothetical protein